MMATDTQEAFNEYLTHKAIYLRYIADEMKRRAEPPKRSTRKTAKKEEEERYEKFAMDLFKKAWLYNLNLEWSN